MAAGRNRVTFQRGDRTVWFGAIVEVLSVRGRRARVRFVAPHHGVFAANIGTLRRHRRGHWLGVMIPEHRRTPTLVEPYVWSHVV